MTGDLVLIVLEIKLIVIGQLERKEDRIKVGKRGGAKMLSEGRSLGIQLLGDGRGEEDCSVTGPGSSSHLLSFGDPPAGDDDDFVLLVKCYDLCYTVRGTGVVNVPGWQESQRQWCLAAPSRWPLETLRPSLLTWQGLQST